MDGGDSHSSSLRYVSWWEKWNWRVPELMVPDKVRNCELLPLPYSTDWMTRDGHKLYKHCDLGWETVARFLVYLLFLKTWCSSERGEGTDRVTGHLNWFIGNKLKTWSCSLWMDTLKSKHRKPRSISINIKIGSARIINSENMKCPWVVSYILT